MFKNRTRDTRKTRAIRAVCNVCNAYRVRAERWHALRETRWHALRGIRKNLTRTVRWREARGVRWPGAGWRRARAVRNGSAAGSCSIPQAQTAYARYTYIDCLRDEVPVPETVNGATLYHLLMTGCTVLTLFAINGMAGSGAGFLAQSSWLLPIMLCVAFFVRVFVSGPMVGFLAPRLLSQRFSGFARGVASTSLSVCVTSPITSAIIAALFSDPDDFASVYAQALATTMPMTAFISFFIVGPFVKLMFHNHVTPAGGLRALQLMERFAPALSRFLGM